jgi:hypoxanthine phosphoribosyltransferase
MSSGGQPAVDVLIGEADLAARVARLGADITRDYAGKDLVVIGVLKGSFVFLADLVRAIDLPLAVDFIGISSYQGTRTSGVVQITSDLTRPIEGKDVLLVEDIVDTGLTSRYLLSVLRSRGAASVELCTLLDKTARRIVPVHPRYAGFDCPDNFVVGYGLDFSERYRNLPDIVQVDDLAALREDPDALTSYTPPAA